MIATESTAIRSQRYHTASERIFNYSMIASHHSSGEQHHPVPFRTLSAGHACECHDERSAHRPLKRHTHTHTHGRTNLRTPASLEFIVGCLLTHINSHETCNPGTHMRSHAPHASSKFEPTKKNTTPARIETFKFAHTYNAAGGGVWLVCVFFARAFISSC